MIARIAWKLDRIREKYGNRIAMLVLRKRGS